MDTANITNKKKKNFIKTLIKSIEPLVNQYKKVKAFLLDDFSHRNMNEMTNDLIGNQFKYNDFQMFSRVRNLFVMILIESDFKVVKDELKFMKYKCK